MWRRILWTVACLGLVTFAPWWITLIAAVSAAAVFSWYAEMVIVGAAYDVLYGGFGPSWTSYAAHAAIFLLALLVVEFIKSRVNTN